MGQSEENRRAVKRVKETIYFDEKLQKYVVGLPWLYEKEKIVEIIKSVNARAMTIKRTKSLRYKLSNDHDLRLHSTPAKAGESHMSYICGPQQELGQTSICSCEGMRRAWL